MTKQSIKTITSKRILVGSVVVVFILVAILAFNFRTLTIDTMTDKGNTVAKFIESSLTTHMRVSTREEKEKYKEEIKKIPSVLELDLIKSDLITKQFNYPQDDRFFNDPFVAEVFKSSKPKYELMEIPKYKDVLRITFPYVAKDECLSCHVGVKRGDTLGVVDFYIDVSNYKEQSILYLYIVMGMIVVVLLGMLYLIFNIIDKHIKIPLDILVSSAKLSFENHTSIKAEDFESLELEDVAKKINLFNQEVIQKNKELKEKNLQLMGLNEEMEATQKEILYTLGNISEYRSKETAYHVQRVAEYSYLIAKLYGLDEDESKLLKNASPMHDMGKIGITDNILKKPAKLTEDEFERMKMHTMIGYEIFKNTDRKMLKAASVISYEHHEKWDGSGYPRGLKGEDIHIFGRITAVADVFDALGNERVYKKAWSDEKIFDFLKEESGKHFDPALIEIFFKNIDQFLEIREKFHDPNETALRIR